MSYDYPSAAPRGAPEPGPYGAPGSYGRPGQYGGDPMPYGAPPPPPAPPKRRMGCLPKLAIAFGVLVALMIVAAIAGAGAGGEEADNDDTTSTGDDAAATTNTTAAPAEAEAPETDSNNETNPPPADMNDDLVCGTQEFIGPKAAGTLTNHSSGLSGYMISVGFLDEAGTRVADGTAFVNNVQPDQTATWEALAFQDVPYATCEIVSVERLAQ